MAPPPLKLALVAVTMIARRRGEVAESREMPLKTLEGLGHACR